jgi:hypothetical protein
LSSGRLEAGPGGVIETGAKDQAWVDILYCLHGPPVNKSASKDIFACYVTNRGIYTVDADNRISLPYDDMPPIYKGEIA